MMESDEPDVFAALKAAGRISTAGGRLVVTKRSAPRSVTQTRANELDLALFRILCRAAGYACEDQTRSEGDRDDWARIERELRRVRPMVRSLMHPEDRAATSERG
jgi:hypothetical protein